MIKQISSVAYRRKLVKKEYMNEFPSAYSNYLTDVKLVDTPAEVADAMRRASAAIHDGVISFRELRNYKLSLFYKLRLDGEGILPSTEEAVQVLNAMSYATYLLNGSFGSRPVDKLASKAAFIDSDGNSVLIGNSSCFAKSPDIAKLTNQAKSVLDYSVEGGQLVTETFVTTCESFNSLFESTFTKFKKDTPLVTSEAVTLAKLAYSGKTLLNLIKKISDFTELGNIFYSIEDVDNEYCDYTTFDQIKEWAKKDLRDEIANELRTKPLNIDDVFIGVNKQGKIVRGFFTLNPEALDMVFEKDVEFFNESLTKLETVSAHLDSRWDEMKKYLTDRYFGTNSLPSQFRELNQDETLLSNILLRTVAYKGRKIEASDSGKIQTRKYLLSSDNKAVIDQAEARVSDIISRAAKAVSSRYARVMLADVLNGCVLDVSTALMRKDIFRVSRHLDVSHNSRFFAFTQASGKFTMVVGQKAMTSRLPTVNGVNETTSGLVTEKPLDDSGALIDPDTGVTFIGEYHDIRELACRLSVYFSLSTTETDDSVSLSFASSFEAGAINGFYTIKPPAKGLSLPSFCAVKRRASSTERFEVASVDPQSCSLTDLLMGDIGYILPSNEAEIGGLYTKRIETLGKSVYKPAAYEPKAISLVQVTLDPLTAVAKRSGKHFLASYAEALRLPASLKGVENIKGKAFPVGVQVPDSFSVEIKNIPNTVLDPTTLTVLQNTPGAKVEGVEYKKTKTAVLASKDSKTVSFTGTLFTDSSSPNLVFAKGASVHDRADKTRLVRVNYSGAGLDLRLDSPLVVLEKDFALVDPRDAILSPFLSDMLASSSNNFTLSVAVLKACLYAIYFNKWAEKHSLSITIKAGGKTNVNLFDKETALALVQAAVSAISKEFPGSYYAMNLGLTTNLPYSKYLDLLNKAIKSDTAEDWQTIFEHTSMEVAAVMTGDGLLLPYLITKEMEYSTDGELKFNKILKYDEFIPTPTVVDSAAVAEKSGFFSGTLSKEFDRFVAGAVDSYLLDHLFLGGAK